MFSFVLFTRVCTSTTSRSTSVFKFLSAVFRHSFISIATKCYSTDTNRVIDKQSLSVTLTQDGKLKQSFCTKARYVQMVPIAISQYFSGGLSTNKFQRFFG